MLESTQLKISCSEDIDKMAIKEGTKLDTVKIDLKGETLDKQKFNDLFKKLSEVKGLHKVDLDLTKYPLDNEQIELVNKAFKNMDEIREVNVHFSETKFEDNQFEKLLHDSLAGKKSIEKIHLVMENVNMSDTKRRTIEKLVNSLPNLKNVHINLQRNNMTNEDLIELHRLIFHFPHKILLW